MVGPGCVQSLYVVDVQESARLISQARVGGETQQDVSCNGRRGVNPGCFVNAIMNATDRSTGGPFTDNAIISQVGLHLPSPSTEGHAIRSCSHDTSQHMHPLVVWGVVRTAWYLGVVLLMEGTFLMEEIFLVCRLHMVLHAIGGWMKARTQGTCLYTLFPNIAC